MHVIWKRPDGYHGAAPSDFTSFTLGGHSLWLHHQDKEQYPFQVSGGWEEKEATKRLNQIINLLPQPDDALLSFLKDSYDNSMKSDREKYFDDLTAWMQDLINHVKGDTWETEIITEAITVAQKRVEALKSAFLAA